MNELDRIYTNELSGASVRIVSPIECAEVFYLVGRRSESDDWVLISETEIESRDEAEQQSRITLRNDTDFWNDLYFGNFTQFGYVPFNRARGYLKGYFDIITVGGREVENLYPNAGFFSSHNGIFRLKIPERQVRFIRCSDGGYAPELCRCPRHRNFAGYEKNRRNFS